MYPYSVVTKNTSPSPVISIIYGGLHRAVWGICISWVILACHWGYGGWINTFLSHPIFQPLSRLTFSIYILSLPIQYMIYHSQKRQFFFNHFVMVSKLVLENQNFNLKKSIPFQLERTFGSLFFIILGAVMLSLIAEAPVIELEKLLLRKKNKIIEDIFCKYQV